MQTLGFTVSLTPKACKQLQQRPESVQRQYRKAFGLLQRYGWRYRSLRTHRYGTTWGSSASMALRFYWRYAGGRVIEVTGLDSH
ncbi:MAG: hypothetical protein F6K03_07785 [Kamptonema sp. SIO4C4]|nr:hypothetical protein [Kamptonema sp. SIO4C4]